MKKLFFPLLLLAFKASFAQEFDTNGTVITDISGTNDYMSKMVVQEDGKLVAIGIIGANSTYSSVVIRYNADGTLDESFGNKGMVITEIGESPAVYGIAIQKDGKIVVVGSASKNNVPAFGVVRYNKNGSLDTTFGENGLAITLDQNYYGPSFSRSRVAALAVAIQPDGKIVVGGGVRLIRGSNGALARYNADGSLDSSFAGSGTGIVRSEIYGSITAMVSQSDNKIVAAATVFGRLWNSGILLRFNNDGSLDSSFGKNGIVDIGLFNSHSDVLLQPDEKIVVGGTNEPYVGQPYYSLSRFNTDGSPDSSFNKTGVVYGLGSGIAATVLQSDGKIVALTHYNEVLRFNNNGSIDSSFYDNGQKKISFDGKGGAMISLALRGNYIYIGGYVNNGSTESPNYDFAITRLDNPTNISFTCPASVIATNDKESCGAVVNNISPVFGEGAFEINFALTGATNTTGNGDASGTQFNTGTTTVTYSLKENPANTCSFTVTVNDVQPPVVSALSPNVTTLWPPNHKMHTIRLNYDSKDNCGVKSCNLTVTSNEPEEDTPDWTIINDHEISLRAERNGDGNGRVYTIKVVCTDEAGNESAHATTVVTVPGSKSKSTKRVGPDNDVEQEERNALIVTASPNPSTNNFTIKVEQANELLPVSLKIIDLEGRVVETKSGIESGKLITAGAKLHAGVYFAEITQGMQKRILKLIKK